MFPDAKHDCCGKHHAMNGTEIQLSQVLADASRVLTEAKLVLTKKVVEVRHIDVPMTAWPVSGERTQRGSERSARRMTQKQVSSPYEGSGGDVLILYVCVPRYSRSQ